MKRIQLLLCGLFLIAMIAGCTPRRESGSTANQQTDALIPKTKYGYQQERVDQLAKFVSTSLIKPTGVLSQNQTGGDSDFLLSESAGLWLIYLAQSGKNAQFRAVYRQTVKNFDSNSLLMYRLQLAPKRRSKVNATLDDLRVIRALSLYAAQNHDDRYQEKAARRFADLKRKVGRAGQLRDFYDSHSHQVSSLTSLAYYDLLTLKIFETQQAYSRQLQLVQQGYLGSQFPLYAANYDWSRKQYSRQPLNTSEALLTLLHLAEVKHLRTESLQWLSHRVTSRTLYNRYQVSGAVSNREESAANYAIAARIFAVTKHPRLYQLAMNHVWRFQIQDRRSKIWGGLGDANQSVSYAFNDLQALIAAGY
ncbi:hypothetical protein IWT25_00204 [Secundilactobacillus pentosiphilus]|uniref:Glycosyl hydrolase family 8 n=1 Tax=Secundilactobacillus pentosiphilus TaxID=1714682 RepID=A0A1Z5IT24_9LACO|nr:hypothetical protein [Secundilactobacillus pentosiphilus]GAX04910.1 hypothetical protein IWT25_00204 [Secundilactobacillus pentosiphilus]